MVEPRENTKNRPVKVKPGGFAVVEPRGIEPRSKNRISVAALALFIFVANFVAKIIIYGSVHF